MASEPLPKINRILDLFWVQDGEMTIHQAITLLAVARQEGRTLAEIGAETGATTQAAGIACQVLSAPAALALPSERRWWRRPRPEGTRLGLVEVRASPEGAKHVRRVYLSEAGREFVTTLEEIMKV